MEATMQTFTDYAQENEDWMISEAGLSRLLSKVESGDDMAIITAYRPNYTKKQNIARNRDLRGALNREKMGVYQLVGHWQECQDPNIEYSDCPKGKLVDAVERSYMVMKPKDMDSKTFRDKMVEQTKKFDQDGIVMRQGGKFSIVNKRGNTEFDIGSKVSVGKISQAYSQHVKKQNVLFVFEGIDIPTTNIGKMMFKKYGLQHIV